MIVHALSQSDAEESVVVQACAFLLVASIAQGDIMRITGKGRGAVAQSHVAEHVPTHEWLRKLERAVLHQFGIESAIGSEVDVFEENAPHRGLNLCTEFLRVHFKPMLRLSVCECQQTDDSQNHGDGKCVAGGVLRIADSFQ